MFPPWLHTKAVHGTFKILSKCQYYFPVLGYGSGFSGFSGALSLPNQLLSQYDLDTH